jgi:hypothetical protein
MKQSTMKLHDDYNCRRIWNTQKVEHRNQTTHIRTRLNAQCNSILEKNAPQLNRHCQNELKRRKEERFEKIKERGHHDIQLFFSSFSQGYVAPYRLYNIGLESLKNPKEFDVH